MCRLRDVSSANAYQLRVLPFYPRSGSQLRIGGCTPTLARTSWTSRSCTSKDGTRGCPTSLQSIATAASMSLEGEGCREMPTVVHTCISLRVCLLGGAASSLSCASIRVASLCCPILAGRSRTEQRGGVSSLDPIPQHTNNICLRKIFWYGVLRRPRIFLTLSAAGKQGGGGYITMNLWIPAELRGGALSLQCR